MTKTYGHIKYDHVEAKLIEHTSAHGGSKEMFSLLLTYPLYIHAEMMTYCSAAKNAASSRAIPTNIFLEKLRKNPVKPAIWLKNKSGMQGGDMFSGEEQDRLDAIWCTAAAFIAEHSVPDLLSVNEEKPAKQSVNRLMSPFLTITTLFTCSKRTLGHILAQRLHWMAQPEIQIVADRIIRAIRGSAPRIIEEPPFENFVTSADEFHEMFVDLAQQEAAPQSVLDTIEANFDPYFLCIPSRCELIHAPFVPLDERRSVLQTLIQSTARSARTSYEKQGKKSTFAEDAELVARLLDPNNNGNEDPDEPRHASPLEHVLWASSVAESKFKGFEQLRKLIRKEVSSFNWEAHGIVAGGDT